jgi:hypothetical protein
MRCYSSLIFLLSFLTISLSVDFRLIAYGSTDLPEPASFRQMLAAQTQTRPNPTPDRGSKRRSFNQLQETGFPRLL